MTEEERAVKLAHVVFNGCDDAPNHYLDDKYEGCTWEWAQKQFGSLPAFMAYMQHRGYLNGRECAFRDYLWAIGREIREHDGKIVPTNGAAPNPT